MARKSRKRMVAAVLSLVMAASAVPSSSFAAIANWEDTNIVYDSDTFGTNGYYNVISKKDYVLVPGAAVESEIVLNNASGTRRQVLHVIEVDPSNPDVSIVPGYNQIDKDVTQEANWSHKELTEMAKYYEDNLGYNIVGGMNTDLYYDTYAPRVLVYNGKDLSVKGKNAPSSSILYVFQDAEGNISCEVKAFNRTEFDSYLADGTLLHAVGVSFGMVVKDGELVSKTEERTSAAAARSMVGVKEDGTLVICMNDGRGANNSVGFCNYEEGEAMLALGCKWAANCDGGGSSTFITKRVGEETFTMRSVPCDGAQRPTAHGIFVASNVAPTGELDVININSEYDYFAPNTTYEFGAEAIDTHGYSMDMPADLIWALSDDSYGTVENGVFTSNGTTGSVEIQAISNGSVVGTRTINIADPDIFTLSATSTVVPYSTADKIRTISIPVVAMIGESNVYYDKNSVSVTLSDEKAGTLDGFNFTATDDTSISGVDINLEYISNGAKLTYSVQFGKGSEVIFDFENGDKAGFMGFEEAKKWSQDNGVENTLVGSDPLAGQFNEYLSSETFTVTSEDGGQVRNGDYALAWRLDNTDASFADWSYNVLFNTGDTIVLRDVANGMKATTLGMWLYIPEGAPGLAFQSQLYTKNADGTYACKQDHFMFTSAATGKQTNLNSATEADIPESRWVYATIDISKYDYLCTPVATDEGNSRSPSIIRTYVQPKTADEITFYIDDITLDYSSAVDDRVLPTIAAPTYSTSDTAVSLENGTAISGNKVAFSATVTDNTALDLTSGKIFVDGVEISAAITGGVLSSKEDAVLAAGTHTVAFEVKDELGNPAKLTRTFTVSGDAVVEISGHNESGETPKAQSVYYVDINAADLANVNKLTVDLKLNNANVWETDGAIVADGFKADFEYNEISEILSVTVEATDAIKSKSLDKTLVSIPVRVWTFDRYNYVNNTYYAPAELGNKPVVNIECDVVYGEISLADKTVSPFGGSISVATELTTISSPYHIHDEELTVLNLEPTATTAGYENRTFCESCKSVVDWGTILEASGHNYEIVDGQFVCSDEGCGHVYESGTGIFEMNDKLYYSIAGKLVTGWQNVDGEYIYIDPVTMEVQTGTVTVSGITYNTDEMGFVSPVWVTDANGTKLSYGPKFHTREWVELDGDKYYFGTDSYVYTGLRFIVVNRNNIKEGYKLYNFTDDGKLIKEMTDANGIITSEVDGTFYVVNGKSVYGGLMFIDGYYYYARTSGEIVCGKKYGITKTNDLLPAKAYTFGEDGKMLNPPEALKNGIVSEDGKLFYYVDGVKTYGGLILIDGAYYYVRTSGEIVVNRGYGITKSNDLLPAGYYKFDAEGKMIDVPVAEPEPEVKNGICADESGKLFYYVDGVKTYGGLMFIDGAYYYARTSGEIVVNRGYGITKSNDLLPAGYYKFDAEGKMIDVPVAEPEPEVKNGICEDENGKLFYYVDGVKTYGGLMFIDGAYYYARTSGEIVVNRGYGITKSNDLLPVGYYKFDADGKMLNPPV
ncbi:MAG: phosphodiester glycosidase family protein [Ruminococcus sp.]|nr:phosphodiester glycosidase family protein [Ruminococcus sp.]